MSIPVTFKTFSNIKSYDEIREVVNTRREVFVNEQKFDLELELDKTDLNCSHIEMFYGDISVGTARVFWENGHGHFGRVAILKEYRNKGLGLVLMKEVYRVAKEMAIKELKFDAQIQTVKFYEKSGAVVTGPEFILENYPHVPMKINL